MLDKVRSVRIAEDKHQVQLLERATSDIAPSASIP